ncbi:MAG: hypothetical protein DSM106950_36080 [Stigonema ocellatum SAG 48.90 = DSM 106950]|nr:hypothetical protein [Stigonema ocellatum SAG 48.90 = DSM 106950]
MHELNIMMFGPRYVGKTSLLTAMYYEYEQKIAKTRIQLKPDLDTAYDLGKKLAQLKSINDEESGVESTESIRSFIFDLGQKGTKPSLRLHFWDYPGGYVIGKDEDERNAVKKCLTKSVSVVIAIDTPALMETKGKWHHHRNRPLQITNWFKEVYQDIKSPRLIILAPIKCESYLQNNKSTADLVRRIKAEYAVLLDLFSSEALLKKIAVVITPVQTVGTVFFSSIDVIEGNPIFRFKKPHPDAKYCPKDNEQPLKYLLRFLLKLHIQQQWGAFNFMRNWFGLDNYLKEAVRDFAKDCKTTDGFEVIQGKELLNIQ